MDRAATATRIAALIAPFNKKGVPIADDTTLDSMALVAR